MYTWFLLCSQENIYVRKFGFAGSICSFI